MVRTYNRKTEKGKTPLDVMIRAAKEVLINNRSRRSVAKDFGIPDRSLTRFCSKTTIAQLQSRNQTDFSIGYAKPRQIFTLEQEEMLVAYIKKASDVYYGLTPKKVRSLAYEYASSLEINVPGSWTTYKMAGEDWFTRFLKRNSDLSIRTPEATSLARCSSFNKTNVDLFFKNLKTVLDRLQIEPQDIWNMDESGKR